ncbi:class II histone deacetylase [Providencia stuartii]|uniref:class II histone deacetylase n=1 Tax=Providencia stuartii TaxID=588 RepID=UPI00197DE589|nr:class II histone deacetylase [Providencia stuartii]MBN5561447.1 class II histone deacetylase [Providencia stuartii]
MFCSMKDSTIKTGLFYHEYCLWGRSYKSSPLAYNQMNWMQPFANNEFGASSASCVRRFKSLIDVSGMNEFLFSYSAPPITYNDAARVHTQEYLNDFIELSKNEGGELGLQAPFGPGGDQIALLSAGQAKAAVHQVMDGSLNRAYAVCVPAGHHALPDKAMGATYLANSSIAAKYALENLGAKKVAILDWDVHHGNGTQAIFYNDNKVLTISMHQDNCFPINSGGIEEQGNREGLGFNINIPLLPGCGHDEYLYALRTIAIPALRTYKPDLIIIGSGYDASTFDPLGHMQLHSQSYREMIESIVAVAQDVCYGKVVVIHEGGYSEHYVPFCALALLEGLSGINTQVVDPFISFIQQQTIPQALKELQENLINHQAIKLGL